MGKESVERAKLRFQRRRTTSVGFDQNQAVDRGAFAYYGHLTYVVTPHLTYTCLGSSKINYVYFVYVVLKLIM
jgi:hypothetical protein